VLPRLTITLTDTNTVLVAWPSKSFGFILQESSSLHPSNWSDAGLVPSDNGVMRSVVLFPKPGLQFYRLKL
jgi:hypothetical protein